MCLPEACKGCEIMATTDPAVSAGHQILDQVVVVCCVKMQTVADPTCRGEKSTGVDHKAAFAPENRSPAQSIIDSIPEIPWVTSVREHCAAITLHLQNELRRCFPAQSKQMRKEYLAADTNPAQLVRVSRC